MQTIPASGAPKELPVAQFCDPPALDIVASDPHRPVDLSADVEAIVLESLWQRRDAGRF
jgi:hypothetical protein